MDVDLAQSPRQSPRRAQQLAPTLRNPGQWPDLLTSSEVAALLRLTNQSIRELCTDGRFPGAFTVGSRWRIPARNVWALMPVQQLEVWGQGPWWDGRDSAELQRP